MKFGLIAVVGLLMACSMQTMRADSLEPLYGFKVDQSSISVLVVSNGCTKPSHFRWEMTDTGLALHRNQKDFCKAMSRLIWLDWALEAGFENKGLVNPLRTPKPGLKEFH